MVYVFPLRVTTSPFGAVIVSKLGTLLIFTERVSSESLGVTVIPSGFEPPADTVTFPLVVRDGASATLSWSTAGPLYVGTDDSDRLRLLPPPSRIVAPFGRLIELT